MITPNLIYVFFPDSCGGDFERRRQGSAAEIKVGNRNPDAIFGPTDPRRTRPYGDEHQVLYTDRWCSPCFRKRCPLVHHKCMKEIGVEAVREIVDTLLQSKRADGPLA